MSQDLLRNETHATDIRGTLHTATKAPVDGGEIDNILAGHMYYDNEKEIIYIFDGTVWWGAKATAS